MFICFDTIPVCDGQTCGHTDRIAAAKTALRISVPCYTRSSATTNIACNADVGDTAYVNLSPVYNLHPINLPTSIKCTYALLIYHY